MSQTPIYGGILGSRWFGVSGGLLVALIGTSLTALVVAGFILAGYLDASGALTMPSLSSFRSLPAILRVAIEIVVGVPIAFGAALYVFTQLIELVMFLTWPVRQLLKPRV